MAYQWVIYGLSMAYPSYKSSQDYVYAITCPSRNRDLWDLWDCEDNLESKAIHLPWAGPGKTASPRNCHCIEEH